MKMQYFHQEEGGGRTSGTPYAGSATVIYPDFDLNLCFFNISSA